MIRLTGVVAFTMFLLLLVILNCNNRIFLSVLFDPSWQKPKPNRVDAKLIVV